MKKSICISLRVESIDKLEKISEEIVFNKSFIIDGLIKNLSAKQILKILKR